VELIRLMTALSTGQCRNCGAPVSHFARLCPSCQAGKLPNPVAAVGIVVAVVVIGALIALGAQALRGTRAPPPAAPAEAAATSPERASPNAPSQAREGRQAAQDYGWIVQAMAECEEEAKQRTDMLHFLIVPVTVTGTALPGWSPSPISAIGNSAVLLNSSDTLIGLRNQALTLYPKPLTFLVSDPTTDTIYKWKAATGVASLKRRGTEMDTLKLGFEIPDVAKDVAWGPVINLKKATCYWINPLIRTAGAGG
jgi:hypothetical protein